jgi:hypothetical protein
MFNLFKRKNKYPNFRILNSFHKRGFYFSRNAEWSWVDKETILATNPYTLELVTLNNWGQLIFIDADGLHTIESYIYLIAGRYTTGIPTNLDHVIIFELFELEKKGLIVLTSQKQVLAKEFEIPGLGGSK